MSGIELNKIVASILLASLIAMMVGFIANILYKPLLHPESRGYTIAVTDNSIDDISKTGASEPINVAELMKNANAQAGSNIIKKCLMCHTFDKDGANKVGPNLWNVVGSKKAKVENYKYSTALTNIGGIWDEESLFHFLHKPNQYIPGTKMTFAGLNKPQDIADVVAFLKTFAHDSQ
ncbi:c-type cytochrome [Candidatus Tisiphia endosymbiont of Nemotelus uliginosus]|uniref:c-type cytochrome n=1 Tax=Candidatus Tisiphia endosymbiont of Nemotelus uliginosus TaxID=3077926 RepID=UPI0035C8E118